MRVFIDGERLLGQVGQVPSSVKVYQSMQPQTGKQPSEGAEKAPWLRLLLPILCLSIFAQWLDEPTGSLYRLRVFINSVNPLHKGLYRSDLPVQDLLQQKETHLAWVRCRTLNEQIRTATSEPARLTLEKQWRHEVLFFANQVNWGSLVWQERILSVSQTAPELSEQLLPHAMLRMNKQHATELLRKLDQRTTPAGLRTAALHFLWHFDPQETQMRVLNLVLHERGRGNHQLHAQIVERVLSPRVNDPLAGEALLECAMAKSVPSPARLLALRALRSHSAKGLSAQAEAIFLSESTDLSIKHEALKLVLALDKARGHFLLLNQVPPASNLPATYRLFRILRKQEGLPSLPPGPMSPNDPR
jgi:hypothetical protein